MKYKAILFDMDGTLLPMDTDEFTKGYFKFLCEKVCPLGIEPKVLINTIWAGVKDMVLNDGSKKNIEAFWEHFKERTGKERDEIEKTCNEFYGNEFKKAKVFTRDNPLASKAVEVAHEKASMVVLATNPIFPFVAQQTRMSFIGLKPEDFDLITSYESDSYAKPNPKYYEDILKRLNLKGGDCLMIGNDEEEDMYAASLLGIDTYLITDDVLRSEKHPYLGKRGSFKEMVEMLENLENE